MIEEWDDYSEVNNEKYLRNCQPLIYFMCEETEETRTTEENL